MRDGKAHPAPVLDQVEHDRLPLLEVGDLVEGKGLDRVLELAVLLLPQPHQLGLDADHHVHADLVHEGVLVARERPARVEVAQVPGVRVVVEAEHAGQPRLPGKPTERRGVGDDGALPVVLVEPDRLAPERRPEVRHREGMQADPVGRHAREVVAGDELADRAPVERGGDEVDAVDPVELHPAHDLGDGLLVLRGRRPLLVVRDDVERRRRAHHGRTVFCFGHKNLPSRSQDREFHHVAGSGSRVARRRGHPATAPVAALSSRKSSSVPFTSRRSRM